jgi:cellulose synthase operon protein B
MTLWVRWARHRSVQRLLFSVVFVAVWGFSPLSGQLKKTTPLAQAQETPNPGASPEASTALPVTPATIAPKAPNSKALDREPAQPGAEGLSPKDPTPYVKPLTPGQYVLEFNRSPVVGYRLRLNGIYDEARIQFTRPRNWQAKGAKMLLRYRHSPALYATRSNLTVLLNGTSIGSVPLNRKKDDIGNGVFEIPAAAIQDYNEIVIAALQNNSPTCTQDPFDPSLWTEVMPDSKMVFEFAPQPVALDFSRYPYPLFDSLSLEPNRLAYLLPGEMNETWLTAIARLQSSLGRLAQFRPIEVRLVKSATDQKNPERLVVVGTPKNQPELSKLKLAIGIKDGQVLDEQGKPLPNDVGVLTFANSANGDGLVLVATGNGEEGVAKAVQFLVQARDRQIGTGQTLIVRQVDDVPTPAMRDWPAFLPVKDQFMLQDLRNYNNERIEDVTVRGADSPVVEYDLKALPDDQFDRGNMLNLKFSYSAQVNPLTSLAEVQLDGIPITGKRLDSDQGAVREQLSLELPADRIKPFSKLQIRFQLDPRERRSCNRATDQQLWATVHKESNFDLKRRQYVKLPDLRLMQYGYPFAAPQDLSKMSIALPPQPSIPSVNLMLKVAERLGRLSRSEAVKLKVYRSDHLPDAKQDDHWVAIGLKEQFPVPQALDESAGFSLQDWLGRKRDGSQVQALPDEQGVIKAVLSPWNADRMLVALTAQRDEGLNQVRDVFDRDDLFFQLRDDTVLVRANRPAPLPEDPQSYQLEFLQRARQQREVTDASGFDRALASLRGNWLTVIPGTILAALLLYGVFSTYLRRFARKPADYIEPTSEKTTNEE